jgi:hypothetical protein
MEAVRNTNYTLCKVSQTMFFFGKMLPISFFPTTVHYLTHMTCLDISHLVATSKLPKNTLSDMSLQLARNWLKTCAANHPVCGSTGSGKIWYPDRLVDLGIQPGALVSPRLRVRTADLGLEDLAYTALSYCWGKSNPFKLRSDNINALRERIPITTLGKSIQEAMIITTAIGLRYLWVDSSCIMQDSLEDWQEQSAVMGDVYKLHCSNSLAQS